MSLFLLLPASLCAVHLSIWKMLQLYPGLPWRKKLMLYLPLIKVNKSILPLECFDDFAKNHFKDTFQKWWPKSTLSLLACLTAVWRIINHTVLSWRLFFFPPTGSGCQVCLSKLHAGLLKRLGSKGGLGWQASIALPHKMRPDSTTSLFGQEKQNNSGANSQSAQDACLCLDECWGFPLTKYPVVMKSKAGLH